MVLSPYVTIARDELNALRAENARLKEELASLELHPAGLEPLADWEEEILRRRLRLKPLGAVILKQLMHYAPRAVRHDWFRQAISPDVLPDTFKTHVCYLRRDLEHQGFGDAIATVWGIGYALDVKSAAAIRGLIAESAAAA
jgi:DNA-binding response OmpR family regulator